MTIPTIDIASFFAGTPADRRAVAAAVDAAGRHLGFLRVAGHGLADGVPARCVATARQFFALPAEVKRRYGPAGPECFNGYWGSESELSGALFGAVKHFDLKEKFKISRPDETHEFDATRPTIGWAYQPNRWPAEIPDFEPTFVAFYRGMEQVAFRIMQVMAAALDMPADWFDDKLDRHESTATWNHYPPQAVAPAAGQFRSSAHRDIGTITLLIEGSGAGLAAGGLEIQDRDGRWLPVAYEAGTVMVNVGDLLRRWTNDRWTSALHRVANPPSDRATLGRVSLAYFQKPNFHAAVAAIPSCVSAGNLPRHQAMPAGEYMRYRMLHSVGVIEGLDAVFEPALMQAADPAYGRVLPRD